ncbi:oxygenase MpaB family protein [Actinomadura sp. WMMB 499]|uniref:oxygenase MpaB family protein n=1 Tax=Actinomadura sp. WMMB 499 TaxID=1219491 RepID=UPI00124656CD|nr:oxygenase MpaB family protein [Actinomadura sp. WMMB 499]QFG23092.1 DUF2236 domain-containing protein [Actinomadura sp. WMMB 499]
MISGLFDDASAIRKVTAEPHTLLGGTAALLLQLAHPSVAAGVSEHSEFKQNPLLRLFSTLDYLGMVIFGTKEEAHRIAWHAMRAHDRVKGPGYSAHDADLLTWVFATLSEGSRDLQERLHGPLDPDLAEQYYRQTVSLATLLGAPREAIPEDRAAFRAYWHEQITTLHVSDVARQEAQAILYPRPLVLRLGAPLNRLITAGLLPEQIRRQYDLPWTPFRGRLFRALIATMSLGLRMTPAPIRRSSTRGLVALARRTRWKKYSAPAAKRGQGPVKGAV